MEPTTIAQQNITLTFINKSSQSKKNDFKNTNP